MLLVDKSHVGPVRCSEQALGFEEERRCGGLKVRRVMIPNEDALHAHLNGGVEAGPGVGGS